MLKRLWRWLWGEPEPNVLEALIKNMLAQQGKIHQQMFNAVQAMGESSSKQAEVLQSYLKLFQNTEAPTAWRDDPEAENTAALEAQGFPSKGTEAEQAEWVLEHL